MHKYKHSYPYIITKFQKHNVTVYSSKFSSDDHLFTCSTNFLKVRIYKPKQSVEQSVSCLKFQVQFQVHHCSSSIFFVISHLFISHLLFFVTKCQMKKRGQTNQSSNARKRMQMKVQMKVRCMKKKEKKLSVFEKKKLLLGVGVLRAAASFECQYEQHLQSLDLSSPQNFSLIS